jgi:hypothetical protein
MNRNQQIPLCRSELLQDISIEIGRRFTPARHPWMSFSVEVDTCDHEGERLERLAVRANTSYETGVTCALWEDGTVWVNVILWPGQNNKEYQVGFYPRCEQFTPQRFAEAFRDTVSVSTRLCYGESPLPVLRRIWNQLGEVQTKGSLQS